MSYKLLLADDSITIQKVVELILAEEDFEIRSTNNGEEAFALIHTFKPDIVLADADMPRMNGYQLCEKIKENPSTAHIPVILLTGAFEPIEEELVKKVNADDYLVKPFESQELISKLNAALMETAVAEMEETEPVVEAEAVGVEEPSVEEDLWAMEEIPEPAEARAWPEGQEGEAGTEELIELAEEAEGELEATLAAAAEQPVSVSVHPEETKARIPEAEFPSKGEFTDIIKTAVQEKISALLSPSDVTEAFIASMTPFMKDSVEKILWEVTPDLVERMLKEMLKGSLESLTKEVEKVIWETVPDLAETMISKEIERIRSEF